MRLRAAVLIAPALALAACVLPPKQRDSDAPLDTVAAVDLTRYAGLWYEIARYDHRFERDCHGVTAEYALRDDGRIDVVNTCRKGAVDGPVTAAAGGARSVSDGNAKLKVRFAPRWIPFAEGDYWVLELDAAYETALIGEPGGRFLWILARTPKISDARLEALKAAATRRGYDVSALIYPDQPPA